MAQPLRIFALGAEAVKRLFFVRAPASEQDAIVMRDQAKLLAFLCLLFSGTGTLNCVLVSAEFGALRRPAMLVNASLIVLLYVGITAIALRWRRDGDDLRFLRNARILFTGLGMAWGCIINLFAFYSRSSQTGLLVGLASGVVSTPIISVPPAIAFSFFLPDAALSLIAVGAMMPEAQPVAAVALASFSLYVAIAIIYSNRTFAGRSEARAALQREVETISVFLREYEEESTDWLWTTDTAGRLTDVSAHMAAALDLGAERLASVRLQELLATDAAANSRTTLDLATCLRDGQPFRDLLTTRIVSGTARWFALTGHPVFNARGVPSGFRGIGRDITASREANERIAFLARHDSLTGLPNRQAFLETIDHLCAQGLAFVLALVDLDNFKAVNDTYGHETGDGLLRCVAGRLRQTIRPGDIAARLGGDEFAVLIPGVDGSEGLAVARRIAARLCDPTRIGDITLTPGASLGVSAAPAHGTEAQRMMMLADLALYKAKEQGKGAARLFVPSMEEEYRSRMTEEAELRVALDNRQIAVEYQPVVDINTGQVVSAEALVRWDHPTRGPISPDKFIPIAERSDLMEHLGELVLRLACNDAAAWPAGIQVNINLSPRQLRSGRFLQILGEALEGSGLPPQRLAIEVTETLFLDGTEQTLRQLRALRETGVSLILDDFGTGYSSLSYLTEIDVDGIKIDAGFTRKLPSRKVAAIYRMIARLTADLNIYVVAEGVETPEQLAWLRQNGIPFAQGFLLGLPRRSPPSTKSEYLA